ncbi:unnamed protein product [Polarella glacialis]|uniref:Uncharacterized protein n=1 Tax=Polarella glacialis TaxID=89957 RepID=A0A813EUN7_POLGL|nr:unnamed protein product [Polarella glacialis]CAE8655107.1 unnamed protein product [Polarella glacialis]
MGSYLQGLACESVTEVIAFYRQQSAAKRSPRKVERLPVESEHTDKRETAGRRETAKREQESSSSTALCFADGAGVLIRTCHRLRVASGLCFVFVDNNNNNLFFTLPSSMLDIFDLSMAKLQITANSNNTTTQQANHNIL